MITQQQKKVLDGYFQLTKPRITLLVLITTAFGFILASKGLKHLETLTILLFGSALVCAGASALNHYLERDVDLLMERTRLRPIPSGLISANHAMLYGSILILLGVFILCWQINVLTAFLSLLTAFLYVLVYTPLKRVSWLNTSIGAIPGALPPMGGWAAAQGQLTWDAWILFFILFTWQHPHFYSIAWMCKDDYARGGFKMLPVVEPTGQKMFLQINLFAIALIGIAILPSFTGLSGKIYFYGALMLSILYFLSGMKLAQSKSLEDARLLLKNSVIYLPALFCLILLDAKF